MRKKYIRTYTPWYERAWDAVCDFACDVLWDRGKVYVIGGASACLIAGGLYFAFGRETVGGNTDKGIVMAEKTGVKISTNPPSEKLRDSKDVAYGTAKEIPTLESLATYRKGVVANDLIRRSSIVIPSVNIGTPVYEGTNDKSLAWGAGTAKPDEKLGYKNYAVSGHNYMQVKGADVWFFSGLQTVVADKQTVKSLGKREAAEQYIAIKRGAPIYVRDDEKIYTYQVVYTEIVEAKDSYVLSDKRVQAISSNELNPLITLTTCLEQSGVVTPNERIVVVGELIKKEAIAKSDKKIEFEKRGL